MLQKARFGAQHEAIVAPKKPSEHGDRGVTLESPARPSAMYFFKLRTVEKFFFRRQKKTNKKVVHLGAYR